MGWSPAWQAEAAGFVWLDPHLRSSWPTYTGASCKVDLCGQLARIFLIVASSVRTWTTFLQSLPQMRRWPCSSHCLRIRSRPVFRRSALWTERHLHISVGPLPEHKQSRIQARSLVDSRLRVIVGITLHTPFVPGIPLLGRTLQRQASAGEMTWGEPSNWFPSFSFFLDAPLGIRDCRQSTSGSIRAFAGAKQAAEKRWI